jgi:hypothetical protein
MPKPHRVDQDVASFLNKDGSASVLLDALPVNGKLQMRTPTPKKDTNVQQV